MNGLRARAIAIVPALLLILAGSGGAAAERQDTREEKLVGTWSLVLVDNVLPDGGRIHLYGPEPRGLLLFDAAGRYSLQIYGAGRAKFASGDKGEGTPEENGAAVRGTNAHFGRYALDAAGHSVTFRIEHALFPNWEGTEQKRSFTLVGDRLKYTVPTPTTGQAAIGEVEWKRLP